MVVQALRGPTSLCGSVLSSWSILYPHTPKHGSLLFSKPFQRNSHLRGLGPGHVGTQCEQGLCRLWALGPQAESPPPEVFFLGRVFSVLEASGSALGTFLMDLTLLGALSPTSSSEISVRGSA